MEAETKTILFWLNVVSQLWVLSSMSFQKEFSLKKPKRAQCTPTIEFITTLQFLSGYFQIWRVFKESYHRHSDTIDIVYFPLPSQPWNRRYVRSLVEYFQFSRVELAPECLENITISAFTWEFIFSVHLFHKSWRHL